MSNNEDAIILPRVDIKENLNRLINKLIIRKPIRPYYVHGKRCVYIELFKSNSIGYICYIDASIKNKAEEYRLYTNDLSIAIKELTPIANLYKRINSIYKIYDELVIIFPEEGLYE